MMKTPELWLKKERRDALRAALAKQDPDALFLERLTRERLSGRDAEDGCYGLESRAVLAWLDEDAAAANEVMRIWSRKSSVEPNSNLGESGWALSGAVMADVLHGLLEPEQKRDAAAALWGLVRLLRVPAKGNPHVVTNNWWAVTHGGALCAALAALRLAGEAHPDADADAVEWSLGRLRAFCHHFGPAGLYHEGLGYIRYTSIFVLSAVQAAQSAGVADLLEEFPNLRNMLPSLYAATSARFYDEDTLGEEAGFGSSLSWNDMGAGAGVTCVDHIGMAIAPEELRPSLKAWYDRLAGAKCPKPTLGGHHVCVPMAWAYFPLGLAEPEEIQLPRRIVDTRQGFWFWRDAYKGADDILFGIYSKASHAGGHHHEDSGSMRIDAYGEDWMAGPGQARTQRRGQSVVYPVGDDKNTDRSYFNFIKPQPDGFLLSLDMRKASGAYHERLISVKKDPSPGAGIAMMLLDAVDDHRQREWIWNWTFGRTLTPEIDEDGRGVRLKSGNGWCLHLRFLAATPLEIEIQALPASQRTFAAGNTHHYAGKPLVSARFAPEPHLAILTAAVWSREDSIRLEGDVHGLFVEGVRWEFPFGAALPKGFRSGVSSGPSQNSRS